MSNTKQTTIEEMGNMKMHSIEWFEAAFETCNVSDEIKQAAIQICHSFNIKGQADPAYIANVIDMEINHTPTTPFKKRFFKQY